MGEIHFTPKDILQKDFKQKMRGYDPTDVDSFLDMVIRDYETFNKSAQQLREENNRLRSKIDELSESLSSQSHNASVMPPTARPSNNGYGGNQQPSANNATNATYMDILKRLSNLENHVFGSHMNNSNRL